MSRRTLGVLVWLLLAAWAPAQDARPLFVLHCASCHGETGDGKGTATLDRPARSFKDGGFSYGNTPEALLRTITFGIPGTPMPAAPSVLTEAERKSLADYVISLGPPGVVVKPGESVLVVRDKPLIVRGKLPPIAPDCPERPRGLLIGTPDGLTFEYRVDDVRLLGVRQGGFVDRRDWIGRGGDALQPLGKVVWLAGKGNPDPVWFDDKPIDARLRATWVDGARCGLDSDLVYKDGKVLARVHEEVSAFRSAVGSGFERRLAIDGEGDLRWTVLERGPTIVELQESWAACRLEDGVHEMIFVEGMRMPDVVRGPCDLTCWLTLKAGATERLKLRVVLVPKWDDAVRKTWIEELAR